MKIVSITSAMAGNMILMHGVDENGQLYRLTEKITMETGLYKIWEHVPVLTPGAIVEVENG